MSTLAVAYARFSSDNQRDESIDAQLRAIRHYAEQNDIVIIGEYIDRAKSATVDDRPEFQRMISAAEDEEFEIIIVHKLDRFARNRYDSAFYKHQLALHHVKVNSVTENLDDSPESIILEGLLEAMSEYYSKNLAREVRKGQNENALRCMHNGGLPPLGYRVNSETKKYEIEEREGETVRFIFRSVIEGKGYDTIIHELNAQGIRTKRGKPFAKNSLYEILHNEKYNGVYVFNRAISKNVRGKRNNHSDKADDNIIRIPDGVPRIISAKDFEAVQGILQTRKHHVDRDKRAKEEYLLSGKIICGDCGSRFGGSSITAGRNKLRYITYRCNNRTARTSIVCQNKPINRDYIEAYVLNLLVQVLFDDDKLPELIALYNNSIDDADREWNAQISIIEKNIKKQELKIHNLTESIAMSPAQALLTALEQAEQMKKELEVELHSRKSNHKKIEVGEKKIKAAYHRARKLLLSGELPESKQLINLYIDKVVVYNTHVNVVMNVLRGVLPEIDANTSKNSKHQKIFSECYSVTRDELNDRKTDWNIET